MNSVRPGTAYSPIELQVLHCEWSGVSNPARWVACNYEDAVGYAMDGPDCLDAVVGGRDVVRIEKLHNHVEALTDIPQPRKYKVTMGGSRQLCTMEECPKKKQSTDLYRSFQVDCKDNSGKILFQTLREDEKPCSYCCLCCACCGPCQSGVMVKVGEKDIGHIVQNWSIKSPSLTIYEGCGKGRKLLYVDGTNACLDMCTRYQLRYPGDKAIVGGVRRNAAKHTGCEDTYDVFFPDSCDTNLKVMCMSAAILIDYRFNNVYRGRLYH